MRPSGGQAGGRPVSQKQCTEFPIFPARDTGKAFVLALILALILATVPLCWKLKVMADRQ